MKELQKHLEDLKSGHEELEQKLGSPEITSDPKTMGQLAKKHSEQSKILKMYEDLQDTEKNLEEAKMLLNDPDPDMAGLAEGEVKTLSEKLEKLQKDIQLALLPSDPNDEKNILVEIRAGTGGEEAALFAADLFRAYARYAESRNWRIEIITRHETGLGGFKEIIFSIEGDMVYRYMKFESGTHRVQRVPETETGGRIHTSAVTVAVLPEAEDVDVQLKNEDLRIDVFRSTGPGGQSVNTTDSAIRITHEPSGIVVSCQDEKSQHKNRAKALKVLRARLLDMEIQKQQREISETRRKQVGTGDRSGRIRTYNFPQNRITDHRINLTLHNLDKALEGDLGEIFQSLVEEDQMRKLEALSS